MRAPDPIVVTDHMRDRVALMQSRLVERFGATIVKAQPGWSDFVAACELGAPTGTSAGAAAAITIGSPAFILKHAGATEDEFGFVVPIAQEAKRWQRAIRWRDDTTLGLWQAGWSPAAVDRLKVATREATLEILIGNVRRTPVAP